MALQAADVQRDELENGLTSNSNPSLSKKSTPIPDSFSASLPYDSRSKENPTAKAGRANLVPVKISTCTGTPPMSTDAVNRNRPFLTSFLRISTGCKVKSQRPTPLFN